jgi:LURP-one-related protein
MPLLRGRRDDGGGTKYQMREKMFAIGDDYWIETDGGERVFKVNGKALRLRETLVLEMPGGEEFTIQEKKLSVRDKMEIERDGHTVATVKKAPPAESRKLRSSRNEVGASAENAERPTARIWPADPDCPRALPSRTTHTPHEHSA